MTAVLVLVVLLAATLVVAAVLWRRHRASRSALSAIAQDLGVAANGEEVRRAVRRIGAAEQELLARASQLEATLDHATVGVLTARSNGEVVYMNERSRALVGAEDSVVRAQLVAPAIRVASSGVPETVDIEVHEPDHILLEVVALAIPGDSDESWAAVYVSDVSEQRRADAVRTAFVANASHELKTPLGALSLLAETLRNATDEDMRARLSVQLQHEARRMARVVDDILRLAEAESAAGDRERLDIADVVEEAVELVAAHAEEQGIAIAVESIPAVTVVANRTQIEAAVQNLVHNAVSYSAPKDGAEEVHVRVYTDSGMVAVEVKDQGVGIASRYQERVFERFFRVDPARSRDSGGTGLGLAIVRNVAIAHAGSVALESEVGVGSSFTLRLPIGPADS